jgi:hypothetical protein
MSRSNDAHQPFALGPVLGRVRLLGLDRPVNLQVAIFAFAVVGSIVVAAAMFWEIWDSY